jgi:acetate kinase
MSLTLVVNPGSATKKYALFNDQLPIMQFSFERSGNGFEICTHAGDGLKECQGISAEEFQNSFDQVSSKVHEFLKANQQKLDAIAVRVVAPGKQFQEHQPIDDSFIFALRQQEFSMPLHVPFILQEIQNIRQAFVGVQLLAISDSAFHRTLPEQARDFSIDRSDAETYDIYRFGYHGLSVASVIRRIHPVSGDNPSRTVVCHVGAGVSVTAVKDGQSVDTSMGYTPTSGLPMGSQVGDLDPGGLLQLMRAKNLKPSEAEMYIHTKGGLYGLAGTADIRHLLDGKVRGDATMTQALTLFLYKIQKQIAASTVALGGLDMLVLTGTACTRSSEFRMMLGQGLEYLGIEFDEDRNDVLVGQDGVCSRQQSAVKVVTIRTDEMGEMAKVVDMLNLPTK